jgi:hypothetical protein
MFLNDEARTLDYRSLSFYIIPNQIKPYYRLSINEEEESIKYSLQFPTEYYSMVRLVLHGQKKVVCCLM